MRHLASVVGRNKVPKFLGVFAALALLAAPMAWLVMPASAQMTTTTVLTSSLNPSFTSGTDSSVTLQATVESSGSPVTTGTVDFEDSSTTISGCGAQSLSSDGTATCDTSFSSEGDHDLSAVYSGTPSFDGSTGTLTQVVNNHTTVVAPNEFENTGAISLDNPTSPTPTPEQATPYPSQIYVSNLGLVTGLTVTLNGISYPYSSDLDFLLVGPQGQSIVLLSNVGPSTGTQNASDVTVTFSDDAASQVPQTTPLGAAGSSVTTKPVDYSGVDTDTFPGPAPSGPYGTPAPQGSATLGGMFDGTNPNGAWSLYAVTVGEGDGTGTIAGGWSIGFAVASQTISFTTTPPTTADAGTSYDASATATSGLAVSYSIDASATPGACSVSAAGVVSFLAAGTCILDANQSGDGNYNAAPQVQQTIDVLSAPGAPTGLSATRGNAEVVLSWTAPASNGGSPITSYNIYAGTSSGEETYLEYTGSAATTTTVIGLTNGTTYYFEVTAVNAIGEGPRSGEASATPATVPGAPSGLSATRGNGELVLNWTAPANNGGSAITSYDIYEGTSSGGERLIQGTGSSGTSTTFVGLTNGTMYYFEVAAVNAIGAGPVSNEASGTPATLPAAPTALTASSGNGQAVLNWAAPASDGGSGISSYNIYEGTSSGGETFLESTGGNGTSFTVTGLTNGSKYYFEVTAVNEVGEGPSSAEASTTPATVPSATTALTVTRGNGQVALSWVAPTNNGGSAITSYDVYEGTASGGETLLESTGGTGTAFTVTGLTNGTPYFFEVSAVNGAGAGLLSNEASATPATISGAPAGLTATPGNAQVSLAWTAPASDGGSAITSYNVYEGTSSGGETLLTSVTGASYLATGLTNGSPYYFEVSAVNEVGEGARSTETSATPNAPPPPAAPSTATPPTTTTSTTTTSTTTTTTPSTTAPVEQGYWLVARDGRVFAFGNARNFNPVAGEKVRATDFVGIAPTGNGGGYWVVSSDGSVFAFGDAHNYGSLGRRNVKVNNIVGIAATTNGAGYWLVGANGDVYTFGNAHIYRPDPGAKKLDNVVGIVATPDNRGYWLAGSDGAVYAYGDARNFGSLPAEKIHVTDIVGIAATASGNGYWLVGADGHVYPLGKAHNFGSVSASANNRHDIVAMAPSPDGQGYWVVGANGAVSNFGDAHPESATDGDPRSADPIVGMAA